MFGWIPFPIYKTLAMILTRRYVYRNQHLLNKTNEKLVPLIEESSPRRKEKKAIAIKRGLSESRLHLMERALAASSNGIVLTDANLPDNPIIYVNPAFEAMTGYSASEVIGRNCRFLQGSEPNQPSLHELRTAIQEQKDCHITLRNYRKDGTLFWNELYVAPVFNAKGYLTHFIGVQTDVTQRQRALEALQEREEKLVHHAFYDPLTGLPNRAFFIDKLGQAIAQLKQEPDALFAVLFLDLDRFKVVNDSLGHLVGDRLLVAFAHRLQHCLQPNDTVARLGGDEFTILLSHIQTIDDATRIAENIHQLLKLPFNLSGYEVFTTASIGIALGTTEYHQPADLLRDADTALYRAKAQGKAWHMVFDTTMYKQAVALLQLETDLRWAIERQELSVHYQPIVSVETERITGFEALVRWHHPERGPISPSEFIPIAEETGLLIPLGQWVLRESCQQLRQWQLEFSDLDPLTISVNFSSRQFSQANLVETICQTLQETNLNPSSLKLEITESTLMANPESAATILKRLKAFGIQLCIDDFGTGYSSLAYLHRFPIDILKVDRSFVNRIDSDNDQLVIVRAITTLAHNLGMSVIAEGVETVKQLEQLRLLQCDRAQGYLFSKPLNTEETTLLLRKHHK
ncbi:hypothetical protein NUACC21_59160 [Scytonema sp. NUACC21]